MLLIQDVVPEIGSNGTVLAGLLALVTTLLSAYTLTQKGRLDDLRSGVVSCEAREKERVSKAESREDAALDRLSSATSVVTSLTVGINEFGGVLKDSVGEVRRSAERTDMAVREITDLKKEATMLREATLRETSDVKRDISEMRREVAEVVKTLRANHT